MHTCTHPHIQYKHAGTLSHIAESSVTDLGRHIKASPSFTKHTGRAVWAAVVKISVMCVCVGGWVFAHVIIDRISHKTTMDLFRNSHFDTNIS